MVKGGNSERVCDQLQTIRPDERSCEDPIMNAMRLCPPVIMDRLGSRPRMHGWLKNISAKCDGFGPLRRGRGPQMHETGTGGVQDACVAQKKISGATRSRGRYARRARIKGDVQVRIYRRVREPNAAEEIFPERRRWGFRPRKV